jgi:aspartyl/asparaginyl-tRNA synthetase
MIEPEIASVHLADNAALVEALLKYTLAALLKEREEDLAFFEQRIEKGWLRNSTESYARNSCIRNSCIWIRRGDRSARALQ